VGGPALFTPLTLREVEMKNRVWVSPMCQYSSPGDGLPTPWHLVHLGGFATGGAGLVMTEASAVERDGRISPEDAGIWSDAHTEAWAPVTAFIRAQGARPGMQLAHAGRKASTYAPWRGRGSVAVADGGWETVGPSAVAFGDYATPREMDDADRARITGAFVAAAGRAHAAGFDVVELHAAHGYLLHQYLSPLSNRRGDRYGGDLEGRMRYPLEVVEAVRAAWPADKPLLVRVSATDWAPVDGPPGWSAADTVIFARALAERGVDLVDCSTGGNLPRADIPVGPGYQVPFAAQVKRDAGVPTGAVGMITAAAQAEEIVSTGQADGVFLARELLRSPAWPRAAAATLGADVDWPEQYDRGRPA
jgi:2,4-dienoyl-CoA reductase-like NADH-dependent reductase (Old Yellow Enzyme family)